MGVDARMIVACVPRVMVTREWLKEKSWALCTAIGAEKFFIKDGIENEAEYRAKRDAWTKAFEAHPLYPQLNAAENRRDVWQTIVDSIGGPAPEKQRLAIDLTDPRTDDEGDPIPGELPGVHYSDDGPTELTMAPEHCLLELNLWGRYYGPGYERGDILTYCAIAEWCERHIPGIVYYGGDSSGTDLVKFGADYRLMLRQHLYGPQGRDYFKENLGGLFGARDAAWPRPKACSVCPGGKYHGERHGWGSTFASYHCSGCGKGVETHDSGKTYTEREEGRILKWKWNT